MDQKKGQGQSPSVTFNNSHHFFDTSCLEDEQFFLRMFDPERREYRRTAIDFPKDIDVPLHATSVVGANEQWIVVACHHSTGTRPGFFPWTLKPPKINASFFHVINAKTYERHFTWRADRITPDYDVLMQYQASKSQVHFWLRHDFFIVRVDKSICIYNIFLKKELKKINIAKAVQSRDFNIIDVTIEDDQLKLIVLIDNRDNSETSVGEIQLNLTEEGISKR